jgi:hypothetical protein
VSKAGNVVAAFDGTCTACGRPYRHGDAVTVDPHLAGLRHAKCPALPAPPPEPPAGAIAPPTWAATMAKKGRWLESTYRRVDDGVTRATLKTWARQHPEFW